MSDFVKTLAEPLYGRQAYIHEASNLYRNRQVAFIYCQFDLICSSSIENMRYMVGYIVDLSIILHGLFDFTHNDVSAREVQDVMNHLVESGLEKRIHHEIRRFIIYEGPFTYRGHDLVVEKMIDLIKWFCVPRTLWHRF